VRVHSECLTGDLFGSARCDCGSQLQSALAQVSEAGRGVVVYLRGGEGKGVGLSHQLRTYNMSEEEEEEPPLTPPVGTPIDSREYGIGAQILQVRMPIHHHPQPASAGLCAPSAWIRTARRRLSPLVE
jgi:3,4-dihydroxy 2-butanone 4-phosphate synthase/GTP cyclohydrolase II